MAWLPRNEFRSPSPTVALPKELRGNRRRRSNRPHSSTSTSTISSSQAGSSRSTQTKDVLPRLWDQACGAIISESQAFSRKRLFKEPKRKLLLVSEEIARKPREPKFDVRDDAATAFDFPLFTSTQLSPVSQIVNNERTRMVRSPPRALDLAFRDDDNVRFTPNIARLRFANALRRSAESQRRQKKAAKEMPKTPIVLQGTQAFGSQLSNRTKSSEKTSRKRRNSSSSDDSSGLLSGGIVLTQGSLWSP